MTLPITIQPPRRSKGRCTLNARDLSRWHSSISSSTRHIMQKIASRSTACAARKGLWRRASAIESCASRLRCDHSYRHCRHVNYTIIIDGSGYAVAMPKRKPGQSDVSSGVQGREKRVFIYGAATGIILAPFLWSCTYTTIKLVQALDVVGRLCGPPWSRRRLGDADVRRSSRAQVM